LDHQMPSLPVLLNNPRILLLGGGKVALHKARVLKENQVHFDVLARDFDDSFSSLGLNAVMLTKDVERADLDPFNIIVDATGNPGVRNMLCRERVARFLLLNIVDDPETSDFYFSSLLNYGRLKIAISTDGASPSLGQAVRDRIKRVIPRNIASLVEEKALERAKGVVDAAATTKEAQRCLAQVSLVGCGPGDINLLTLQACRCIEEADVVLYDHLVSEEILNLVPERTEKIYVGKQKQAHSLKQGEINKITLQHALRGLKVVRLKSGDPYIFGRGAEEAEFLARHGVRVQVTPGISSAVAAPSAAGIPLTARGYATNVSIVSAHLAGSRLNADWLPLLHIRNHTTVVLMGLSFASEIADKALLNATPPDMPVAIVSNATLASQKVIVTTLDKLVEKSRQAVRPAVLVFGDVVKLHSVLPQMKNGEMAD
jgi:uroporphyrin-III C-methyltransferase/precorrin-2 dehydrogenase/sirohydrochlorin ferrochelatase